MFIVSVIKIQYFLKENIIIREKYKYWVVLKMPDDVSDELKRIYQEAEKEGIYIVEYLSPDGGSRAAAGSIELLEKIEQETGKEIDVDKFSLGDLVNLTCPGRGKTREEACLNAIKAYKESKKEDNTYSLYGSFEERGYKVEAYIPNSDEVPLAFVLRAYKEDELVKEMKVPMHYRPIFGVDVADVAALEEKTEELMKTLP